ncbi:DNA polymerase I [Salmonella enterica subsp. enterica serovar Hartford]|nr:DNA polymerase I [Salmonella enterica subsp. enterica serovar Hartford]
MKKTPGGAPSTSEEVLEELALDYPLPKVILEYRGLAKLKSTYTDKLPLMINPKTGRVHTSYHQAVTATDVYRPPIRTCKIFRCAMKKAAAFVRHLLRLRIISSCLRTIHRLSCVLWRIFPVIKGCSRRSPKGKIFTAQRRRKSLLAAG